jgi:hypothetical protein
MTKPDDIAKDNPFEQYRRVQVAELRPWKLGDNLSRVSISQTDLEAGSPRPGDMIARNPKNHEDQWLVAQDYFLDNFEPIEPTPAGEGMEPVYLRSRLNDDGCWETEGFYSAAQLEQLQRERDKLQAELRDLEFNYTELQDALEDAENHIDHLRLALKGAKE